MAAPAQSNVPKYTLTIKGFDLAGAPASLDGSAQVTVTSNTTATVRARRPSLCITACLLRLRFSRRLS
jgi:hypothetical protein